MIFEFDDACWSAGDAAWKRGLIEALVLLSRQEQHAILADVDALLAWCDANLTPYTDYFRTRIASTQCRANALTVYVSPQGGPAAVGSPPWTVNPSGAADLALRPLRLVLENNMSDRLFVEATIASFAHWCTNEWLTPALGGGADMMKDIAKSVADPVAKWRTFYLFDSDRLHPNELANGWTPPGGDGCQGHSFESACSGMPPTRWHRLNRRSIENYLPEVVLTAVNSTAAAALCSSNVGNMANFYNLKTGLAGDGVHPVDPKKAVRAARCLGFWTTLPAGDIAALESGFGKSVSDEFRNVPAHHAWPAEVIIEVNALADALQDAM